MKQVAEAMVIFPKTHSSHDRLEDILDVFKDEHVHMALVVEPNGQLVTCIQRSDLVGVEPLSTPVSCVGTLVGRTVGPHDELAAVMTAMLVEGRRRLAVVDASGRLLGLLCLKRTGSGFCSDEGIQSRAIDSGRHSFGTAAEASDGLSEAACDSENRNVTRKS